MSKSKPQPAPAAGKKRRRWLPATVGLLLVAAAMIAVFSFSESDWAMVQRQIAGLNAVLLFALMATLPVGGFSVGVVYLIAGVRFGPLVGGAVVAAATAVHLVATHWIAHSFLRGPLERLLARRRYHLPEIPPGEHAAVSVMAALVPGVPYFARNYLLALSGVPFRIYFAVCLPIYVARSYVTIFLGDMGTDPSRSKFLILAAVYALKLGICAILLSRLRKRYKQRQSDAAKANSDPESSPAGRRKNRPHLARST